MKIQLINNATAVSKKADFIYFLFFDKKMIEDQEVKILIQKYCIYYKNIYFL